MRASNLIECLKQNIQKTGDYEVCVLLADNQNAEPVCELYAFLFAPPNQKDNMYLIASAQQKPIVDRLSKKMPRLKSNGG